MISSVAFHATLSSSRKQRQAQVDKLGKIAPPEHAAETVLRRRARTVGRITGSPRQISASYGFFPKLAHQIRVVGHFGSYPGMLVVVSTNLRAPSPKLRLIDPHYLK